MRPFQWWTKSQNVSPPLRRITVTRRGFCALKPWKRTQFLSKWVQLGACLRRKTITTACPWWAGGRSIKWTSSESLVRGASELAHKSFETTGSFPGSQTVLTAADGLSCVLIRMDNMTSGSSLNRQGALCSRPLYRLARSVLLWGQTKFLSVRAVYIPGHLNSGADLLSRQRMEDGEWRLHPQVVNLIWQRFERAERSVCFELN